MAQDGARSVASPFLFRNHPLVQTSRRREKTADANGSSNKSTNLSSRPDHSSIASIQEYLATSLIPTSDNSASIRIDVLGLSLAHEAARLPNVGNEVANGSNIGIFCQLSLFAQDSNDEEALVTLRTRCILQPCRQSTTSVNASLGEPFIIHKENLLIDRDGSLQYLDFAKSYRGKLAFSAQSSIHWPPFGHMRNTDDTAPTTSRRCVLTTDVSNVLRLGRQSFPLSLIVASQNPVRSDYTAVVMVSSIHSQIQDVCDGLLAQRMLQRSLPYRHKPTAASTRALLSTNVTGQSNEAIGVSREGDSVAIAKASAPESETMASTASPAAPDALALQCVVELNEGVARNADKIKLIYVLPGKEVSLPGMVCYKCLNSYSTIKNLGHHLDTHKDLAFDPLSQSSDADQPFRIRVRPKETPEKPTRTAAVPDAIVQNSDSDSSDDISLIRRSRPSSSASSLPSALGITASRTNIATLRLQHSQILSNKELSKQANARPREQRLGAQRNFKVPQTKQPLYHPLSRARLIPGFECHPYTADESWLVHKHREIIEDYADMTDQEKEFMIDWDAYFGPQRITSEAYLREHYNEYVKERAAWLAASRSRPIELVKRSVHLVATGALDARDLAEAASVIEAARKRQDRPAVALQEERLSTESKPKSKQNCAICGSIVQANRFLRCCNKDCSRCFYHDDCATKTAKMPVDQHGWKCNACQPAAKASTTDRVTL